MSLIVAMALSGLEPEHWNGQLKDIYDQGAFLVNIISASKTSSTASTKSSMSTDALLSPTLSQECLDFSNCFASPRNNASEKQYDNLFFQISKKGKQLEMYTAKKTLPSVVEQIKQYHVFDDTKELVYQNRNLLDLGSNLKHSFGVSHAKLPDDINGYFENRSQISRLNGAYPPENLQNICRSNDCCFKEYFY